MEKVAFGVIGGSGLYSMPELEEVTRYAIETPFGAPSSDVVVGTLRGKRVAFIARHGEGHVYAPSTVPQRANIYAMKTLGVRYLIGINACGSLREDYMPGDLVVPDQVFDYTLSRRERSFFEDGIVAHVSVAEPFDARLSYQLADSAQAVDASCHFGGTFLVEDGARFSTRAESSVFRQWGCDIIGMTTAPEVFLAREAEIAYATLAHITDYDSWREETEPVTVEMVMTTFKRNIAYVQQVVAHTIEHFDETLPAPAHTALSSALITARHKMPSERVAALKPILARVLGLVED